MRVWSLDLNERLMYLIFIIIIDIKFVLDVLDKAFYALDFIALMTFSLSSSLSSDLKVPIVFVTCCYHTPSSIKERAHSRLSYNVSSVKDGIVFPSFHIFALVDGQKRTRILYVWARF